MSRSVYLSRKLIDAFLAAQRDKISLAWLYEQHRYLIWWERSLNPLRESGRGGRRWPATGPRFVLQVSLALQGVRAQGARLSVLRRILRWCVTEGILQPHEHPLQDLPLSFFESPDAVAEAVAKWKNLRRRAVKAENTPTS